jgi:hypothetical protein
MTDRSRYQTGEVVRVARSDVQLAAYNPRKATPDARRRMREKLRVTGLVGPSLVWNRQTGHLVSGHLRLMQLDVLEGRTDYHLDVTAVDWSPEQERRENVAFNVQTLQGAFDLDALGEMLAADLEGLEAYALDPVDLGALFGADPRFDGVAEQPPERKTRRARDKPTEPPDANVEPPSVADVGPSTPKAAIGNVYAPGSYSVTIVCRDAAQRDEVVTALGLQVDGEGYVSAERVLARHAAPQAR